MLFPTIDGEQVVTFQGFSFFFLLVLVLFGVITLTSLFVEFLNWAFTGEEIPKKGMSINEHCLQQEANAKRSIPIRAVCGLFAVMCLVSLILACYGCFTAHKLAVWAKGLNQEIMVYPKGATKNQNGDWTKSITLIGMDHQYYNKEE